MRVIFKMSAYRQANDMYGKLAVFVLFMNEFVSIWRRIERERKKERISSHNNYLHKCTATFLYSHDKNTEIV